MTNNACSVISMAACPQLPYELARQPRERQMHRNQPSGAIDILAISDNPRLIVYLSGLFHRSGWSIARARTCQEGVAFVKNNRAAVAVCEESLPDGFWHDTAVALSSLPDAPALIVVSSDPSLVHEVLALGGFDVLVRPLRESDVVWTIATAWHAWKKRFGQSEGVPCEVRLNSVVAESPPVDRAETVQLVSEPSNDARERILRDSHRDSAVLADESVQVPQQRRSSG
jgi:DNA-binding NtrC family response regulator